MDDRQLGVRRTAQSIQNVATRWHIPVKDGAQATAPVDDMTLAVRVPPADCEVLEAAAHERGLSTAGFAADILHLLISQRLIRAVMDDGRD
jgi:hypothetical protein